MMATTRQKPYGTLIREVLQRYPVRNARWHYHPDTDAFTADIVELRHDAADRRGMPTDPWNRPLPPFVQWQSEYHGDGEEQELCGWKVTTTVNGVLIELTIFND